jgi:hypothetical protein
MTFRLTTIKSKLILPLLLTGTISFGQNPGGSVTGNTETTFQYLQGDSLIGAVQPESKSVMNSYTNVNYTLKGFSAGVRFESYLPHILGYPDRYSGTGIGYKYASYSHDMVDVTVGNFYEQFGSGMAFRSYEERTLGLDNAMEGFKIKFRPTKGAEIKAVYGKQRYSFTDGKLINSEGVVRGIDAEVNFKEFYNLFAESKFNLIIGGSFVSKYQQVTNPDYYYPANVGAYGGRMKLAYKDFYIEGEHIIKEQDPSDDNGSIYNYGHGTLITAGYSQKGLGVVLQAKSMDNMSYRSDPNAKLSDLNINYSPALSKTHTYNLAATLYPYSSQTKGEMAFQADVMYKIPKKTILGGKYGTNINVNYSVALNPMQHFSDIDTVKRIMYQTNLFDVTDSVFNSDFSIQIKRKLNKKLKMSLTYFKFKYNNALLDGATDKTNLDNEYVKADIFVVEAQYKINRKNSVRAEVQGLFTKQDVGDWGTFLVEYNISPKWFFAVMDQFNYGNSVPAGRLHYLIGSAGYLFGNSRVMATYGKQKAGIFCIGGVCRTVPATNGLTLTFTSSF